MLVAQFRMPTLLTNQNSFLLWLRDLLEDSLQKKLTVIYRRPTENCVRASGPDKRVREKFGVAIRDAP